MLEELMAGRYHRSRCGQDRSSFRTICSKTWSGKVYDQSNLEY